MQSKMILQINWHLKIVLILIKLMRCVKTVLRFFYDVLFPRRKKQIRMDVFHENEIGIILKKLKLLEKFNNNELACDTCGRIVTRDNLYAIQIQGGVPKVCCNNQECSSSLFLGK